MLTFAGCSETVEPPVIEKQDGPLTAAELRYFNEQFFNSEDPEADPETVLAQVYDSDQPDCAEYEINTATLDALLTDKTGLTLQ